MICHKTQTTNEPRLSAIQIFSVYLCSVISTAFMSHTWWKVLLISIWTYTKLELNYRDLHYWRSNQRPQMAEPNLYNFIFVCVCVCVCVCVWICMCVYICIYTFVCMYMCACMYVCVCVYIYIHTHTHTHTHTLYWPNE